MVCRNGRITNLCAFNYQDAATMIWRPTFFLSFFSFFLGGGGWGVGNTYTLHKEYLRMSNCSSALSLYHKDISSEQKNHSSYLRPFFEVAILFHKESGLVGSLSLNFIWRSEVSLRFLNTWIGSIIGCLDMGASGCFWSSSPLSSIMGDSDWLNRGSCHGNGFVGGDGVFPGLGREWVNN